MPVSPSPLLLFHICAGILSVVAGAAALSFGKGSRWHRASGNVFFISMLGMAAAGVVLAVLKNKPGDILGGTLTIYLVATAWVAARRAEGKTDLFDWSALLVSLALGAVTLTFAFQAAASPTGLKHGYPAGNYLFLGSIALIAAVGDVRMLVRGRISGARRIARHLWRMCFALFIAAASIFLARAHVFPEIFRRTGALVLLSLLPLILMIFWLFRVRLSKASRNKSAPGGSDIYSLST